MGSSDQDHFDTYTPQNRIKHNILGKYFKAYMTALGNYASAFHYVDGFAGPGKYEGTHDGSPLIALSLLAGQRRPWSASFVESDGTLFTELVTAVNGHADVKSACEPPYLGQGEFADHVGNILARQVQPLGKLATFAFVDPCGVRGVRMCDLASLLAMEYGECLLFWNYDGLNRWLGAVFKGTHPREGLVDFFGDVELVEKSLQAYQAATTKQQKEQLIRDLYIQALAARSGARFILPFRFEAKDSERTSHYLVHCCSHGLGFKIMKEVMGGESTSDDGVFEFLSDAETIKQLSIFRRPDQEHAQREILKQLAKKAVRVSVFTDEWVRRPTDFFRPIDYKKIVLELESAGKVEIWDKTNSKPTPAEKRKRAGSVTLGDDRFVRLSKS